MLISRKRTRKPSENSFQRGKHVSRASSALNLNSERYFFPDREVIKIFLLRMFYIGGYSMMIFTSRGNTFDVLKNLNRSLKEII